MSVRGSISSLRHSFNMAVGKVSRSHVADEDSNMIPTLLWCQLKKIPPVLKE